MQFGLLQKKHGRSVCTKEGGQRRQHLADPEPYVHQVPLGSLPSIPAELAHLELERSSLDPGELVHREVVEESRLAAERIQLSLEYRPSGFVPELEARETRRNVGAPWIRIQLRGVVGSAGGRVYRGAGEERNLGRDAGEPLPKDRERGKVLRARLSLGGLRRRLELVEQPFRIAVRRGAVKAGEEFGHPGCRERRRLTDGRVGPRATWRLEDNPGGLAFRTAMLHRHRPVTPCDRCGGGRGVARLEGRLEFEDAIPKRAFLEADREGSRAVRAPAPAVHDLRECSKVIWGLAKVRLAAPVGGIPYRLRRGKKRGLAGAVLTDEQGERRQGHGLPLAEAAEVPQRDLPKLLVFPVHPRHLLRAVLRECRG